MRMILYGCLLTIALVCHPFVAVGDEQSHRKAAENLLLVMEVGKSLPKIADQVVETQMQQNPQLAAQREVLQRFLTKYLNWESVKEDTITAYTNEFTEPELQKLTEFYKTPVGTGHLEPSPVPGLQWGAVIWRMTAGDGAYTGATGYITSNFTVSAEGEVVDNHYVRMVLP